VRDAGNSVADDDASIDAGVAPIEVGAEVDIDGDGVNDGQAVDTNGDGIADGVDTDGDGTVDEPLPSSSGSDGDGGTALADGGGAPFPVSDAGQVLCGSAPCACSNGLDDDHDGLSDLADPECVSSWDNDEGSLATGIPGDNRDDACQDCFFDGNSGSGNDGCYLPSSCFTEGNASSGHGRCGSCEQTDQCRNFCKAYTPNGCDCFGCCTVRLADGSNVNVALGNGCNIDGNDVTGCNTCVPNDSFRNECGRCELCPGKTVADLPADCQAPPVSGDGGTDAGDAGTSTGDDAGTGYDGGTSDDASTPPPPPPVYTCEDGATICGAGLPACDSGYACEFGCCTLVPLVLL
jgi:hypothetical protein